ncbi:MAG TPA: ASCH domain-containing protein [Intrasporangiaceae bacterium]|nr:ASCH domain-containing protein [Intrasporangiaceae bacterium]
MSESTAPQRRDDASARPDAAATAEPGAVSEADLDAFWAEASTRARLDFIGTYGGPTVLGSLRPPAWAFGATAEQADELLALVLAGRKTATAGALWDYEAEGEPVPQEGALSIVLDGAGHPRALIVTTDVDVVPFAQVGAEHAAAEGEGDGSLDHWRRVHEDFFTEHATHDRGFSPDMPVVLERFKLVYPTRRHR